MVKRLGVNDDCRLITGRTPPQGLNKRKPGFKCPNRRRPHFGDKGFNLNRGIYADKARKQDSISKGLEAN